MNKFFLGIKREYWEYRKTVIMIPLILSVLVMLASGVATLYHHTEGDKATDTSAVEHEGADQTMQGMQGDVAQTPDTQSVDEPEKPALSLEQVKQRTTFRFIGIYISIAWITALFYLLSSLYADRKDNSILYWKSLPVSETQNVLTKYLFGAVGFSAFSVVIAWVVYLLLMMVGWGAINSLDGGESWHFIERTFDAERFFIWPLLAIVLGTLWGAPYFSFALLVSSMSKRFPLLLFLIAPLVIAALEGILFRSTNVIGFFTAHFPFAVVDQLADSASIGATLSFFLIEQGSSLALGWILSALFLWGAIWHRNNRFEN